MTRPGAGERAGAQWDLWPEWRSLRRARNWRQIAHLQTCMTARRWCFTINNPTDEDDIATWNHEQIKLLLAQLKEGEEGTQHLQGYLEMNHPCRLAALKKLNPRAHWEKAKGTRHQAMLYCLKEESSLGMRWWLYENCLLYFEEDWPESLRTLIEQNSSRKNGTQESTKSRLLEIQSKLSEGNSQAINEVADNEFDIWVRYYRAFEKYLLMKTPARNWKTIVHVLQGPTGTGKSKWAMDMFPNAYWKQRSNWWDGYTGQENVILDEFYGWLPFDLLLRLCDRYPLMVETKGGQTQFAAKTIVITTNMLPCNWYKSCYFPSFARRVTLWHILPIWGEHREYCDYGEFLKYASENVVTP